MFTPKWKKDALHLFKGARKFIHYKRDLLAPDRIDEIESRRGDLLQAIKLRDRERVKEASNQLQAVCEQALPREKPLTWLEDNVEVMFVAIVIALGLRTYYLQPFRIPTGSMQPTLNGIIGTSLPENEWPAFPKRAFDKLWYGRTYVKVINDRERTVAVIRNGDKGQLAIGDINYLHFFSRGLIQFTDGSKLRLPGPVKPCSEIGLNQCLEKYNRGNGNLTIPAGAVLCEGYLDTGDLVLVDKFSYHFRKPKRGEVFVFDTLGIVGISERNKRSGGHNSEQEGGTHYIKRLCAVPGDSVSIAEPNVLIDGKVALEPGIQRVAQAKGLYDPTAPNSPMNTAGHPLHKLHKGYHLANPQGDSTYQYLSDPTDHIDLRDHDAPPGMREYVAFGDNTNNSLDSRYWGTVKEFNLVGPALFSLWPFGSGHWGFIK